jgi:uncharacterized protein (TIGR02996 family)
MAAILPIRPKATLTIGGVELHGEAVRVSATGGREVSTQTASGVELAWDTYRPAFEHVVALNGLHAREAYAFIGHYAKVVVQFDDGVQIETGGYVHGADHEGITVRGPCESMPQVRIDAQLARRLEFLKEINRHPGDPDYYLVYSDWLEEQELDDEAQAARDTAKGLAKGRGA